jgi:Tfp pilus assembly protein PilN
MSQQINLFNPALLKQRNLLSANNLVWLVLGMLVIIAVVYFYLVTQTAKSNATAEVSAHQLRTLSEQLDSLRKAEVPKIKNVALENELRVIENSLLRRQHITEILQNSNFGNTDGYSAYLTAFARQIPANLWLTGFQLEGAGYDLVLQGRTLQPELLPLYVAQLKREKIMQGKTFSALQMHRPVLDGLASSVATNAATGTAVAGDAKKTASDAPYLEFELHSSEAKEKPASEAKSK